jgi:hypothetical protein
MVRLRGIMLSDAFLAVHFLATVQVEVGAERNVRCAFWAPYQSPVSIEAGLLSIHQAVRFEIINWRLSTGGSH